MILSATGLIWENSTGRIKLRDIKEAERITSIHFEGEGMPRGPLAAKMAVE